MCPVATILIICGSIPTKIELNIPKLANYYHLILGMKQKWMANNHV